MIRFWGSFYTQSIYKCNKIVIDLSSIKTYPINVLEALEIIGVQGVNAGFGGHLLAEVGGQLAKMWVSNGSFRFIFSLLIIFFVCVWSIFYAFLHII